jgi:heat-inducible transcriptional repressor
MKVPALESKRTQQILADIVRTYIETGEPVSSRSIARLFPETLSPATVRNVMADLEEEGFLFQPHTSAGRVPTASAYRFFVEEVAAQGTASHEDREWIRTELRTAQTPDALLERASHVLASISRGLGIIISPPLAKTTVEHLRFLLLPDGRVLVVLVAKGGMTRDKVIRTERTFAQEELDRISDYLNQNYPQWTLEAIRADLRAKMEQDQERYGKMASGALLLCDPSLLAEDASRRVYVEGAAQIATAAGFADQEALHELLAAIEERGRLVALLSSFLESPEPVHVELGLKEMSAAGKHLALVSAPFSAQEHAQGTVGILGPMRMQYERVVTAVAFLAQYLSENSRGSQ